MNYIGQLVRVLSMTPPPGAVFCRGQVFEMAKCPALFLIIGEDYGSTATQFKLPNLEGIDPTICIYISGSVPIPGSQDLLAPPAVPTAPLSDPTKTDRGEYTGTSQQLLDLIVGKKDKLQSVQARPAGEATYTAIATDEYISVHGGSNVTVNLPNASLFPNRTISVNRRNYGGTITINGGGSQIQGLNLLFGATTTLNNTVGGYGTNIEFISFSNAWYRKNQ